MIFWSKTQDAKFGGGSFETDYRKQRLTKRDQFELFFHLFSLYTDYGHPDGCTIFLSHNVTMEFPQLLGQQHPVVVVSSFEQSMLFSTAKLESKCSVSLLTDKQNGISKRMFDAFGKHVRVVLPESVNSCSKIPVRGLKRPLVWFCHKREQVPIIF